MIYSRLGAYCSYQLALPSNLLPTTRSHRYDTPLAAVVIGNEFALAICLFHICTFGEDRESLVAQFLDRVEGIACAYALPVA